LKQKIVESAPYVLLLVIGMLSRAEKSHNNQVTMNIRPKYLFLAASGAAGLAGVLLQILPQTPAIKSLVIALSAIGNGGSLL
jgi:hypothetical protein